MEDVLKISFPKKGNDIREGQCNCNNITGKYHESDDIRKKV